MLTELSPNVTITLTGSDADGCSATFTFTITQSPTGGSLGTIGGVTCDGDNNLSADVTYDPTASDSFSDSFDFTIDDGMDTSNTATVSITVGTVSISFPRPANIGTSSGPDELIISGGLLFCTGGTLGARVSDGVNTYALSNAHVYARADSTPATPVDAGGLTPDLILQPGRIDLSPGCGTAEERTAALLGTLSDWTFGGTVDAAIALVSADDVDTSTPSDGYGTPKTATLTAEDALLQNVQKYGRTSGHTTGTITGINATLTIDGMVFTDQLFIEGDKGGFLQGGDSGSLLVIDGGTDDRKSVGLLFASSRQGNGKFAWANELDNVLAEFGITIDGE